MQLVHGAKDLENKPVEKEDKHPMSHITGARNPLAIKNSLALAERIPKYGVETPYEEELGQVNIFQKKNCGVS